jgi:two-component system, chemotaxis family, protein-glutamate methylesterase/glutaminase
VRRTELVTIGTSLGGLQALLVLLASLPAGLAVPMVIVQHRGPANDGSLVGLLQQGTALRVAEAEDKMPLEPQTVYVAPSDYHLLIEDRGWLSLSTEAPVRSARPSIDVLFETAADAYGAALTGVLLTGASADGAAGLAHIKRCGGHAIVQDPDTAESPAMPAAGIAAAAVDYVLPLERIGGHLVKLVEGMRA